MHTRSAPTPALGRATFDSARYSALLPDAPVTGISSLGDLTAVEDVVAEVLHLEDGGVGTAGRRLVEMRLNHLADHDVMVALLDDAGDAALDGARRVDQQRRARRALAIGLAGN